MILKVKYDDLGEVGRFVGTKKDEILEVLGNLEKLTGEIPEAWKGIDSDIFIAKANSYIANQKVNVNKIGNLSELLKVFSIGYKDKDHEWKEEMKQETMKHDRYQ